MEESNQGCFGSNHVSSSFERGHELKSGKWAAEEDQMLKEYVRVNGEGNWNRVHQITGLKRSGKSCKQRWKCHLRHGLKQGAFSEEEKEVVFKLHAEHGNNWTLIATQLRGRSNNAIKSFWNNQMIKMRREQGKQRNPGSFSSSSSASLSLSSSGVRERIYNVPLPDVDPSMLSTYPFKFHPENNNSIRLDTFVPLSSSAKICFTPFHLKELSHSSSPLVERAIVKGALLPIQCNIDEENKGLLDSISSFSRNSIHGGDCNTDPQEGTRKGKAKVVTDMPAYGAGVNKVNIAEDSWHEMKSSRGLLLNDETCEDMKSLDRYILDVVDTLRPSFEGNHIGGNINSGDRTRGNEYEGQTSGGSGSNTGEPYFQKSNGNAATDEYVGLEWFLGSNDWIDDLGKL